MVAKPKWDDLDAFLSVAKGGSLAAGARDQDVDPSTLHRRLKRLEETLSVRLFQKTSRGYFLTPDGEVLFRSVEKMEQNVIDLQSAFGQRSSVGPRGLVRLNTVDDVATEFITPCLASFYLQYPLIQVELNIDQTFVDLGRQESDLALRFGKRPEEADWIVKKVTQVSVGFFASRQYLELKGTPKTLEDLATHQIVAGGLLLANLPAEKALRKYAQASNISFVSNSMLIRRSAIAAHMGIGFLGTFAARRADNLVQLPFDLSQQSTTVWLSGHRDVFRLRRVKALADFLLERMPEQLAD